MGGGAPPDSGRHQDKRIYTKVTVETNPWGEIATGADDLDDARKKPAAEAPPGIRAHQV
jgi:hypothetical protein